MSGIPKKLSQEMVALGPRKVARTMLDGGCISIIAAFNMTDDPARPWRFPKETQAAAARLLQQLVALFDRGEISEHSAPIAQDDAAFQALMARCTVTGGTTLGKRPRPRRGAA